MDLYYLLPPQKQKLWQRLALSLQFFSLGFPYWWGLPRLPNIFVIFYYVTMIFGPISFFFQSIFLYIHYDEFSFIEFVDIFCIIMFNLVAMVKIFSALTNVYKKVLTDFIAIIHINNYEPRNKVIEQVIIKCNRYDRFIVYCNIIINLISCTIWLFKPIINNIISGAYTSNGTIKLNILIYLVVPFDYEYNLRNWFLMNFISTYLAYFGTGVVCVFDSILLCIVNHLIGRIKILKINFKDLTENIDEYTNEEITQKLGNCIRDHVLIIRFFNDMQGSHGLGVTAYYAYNMIFDALILIVFTFGDLVRRLQYMLVVLNFVGGLIGMSLVMEEIRIKSDELSNDLYFVPWERMTISNKRIFLVLLTKMQPKLMFKAFAGLEAGIKPVISIMKSTFSYYVMFKTRLLANKDNQL